MRVAVCAFVVCAGMCLVPAMAGLGAPAMALGGAPTTVLSQATLTTTPYELQLAPDGELRVLSFDTGFVNAAVVAKPWLLTVLVQGHDVILQAKASTGDTQLIVYVGGIGTLWHVTVTKHGPVAARIEISADQPAQAGPGAPEGADHPVMAAGPAPASAAVAPSGMLRSFVYALSPAQRAQFQAWQADPTMERLAGWLETLSPGQRARFDELVRSGAVTLPQATTRAPGPALVDTTTVIHGTPAAPSTPAESAQPPAAAPASAPSVPPAPAGPVAEQAMPVAVTVSDPPSGMTWQVSAVKAGDTVTVTYAIQNLSSTAIPGRSLVVTTASGKPVDATHVDASGRSLAQVSTLAPGQRVAGRVTFAAATLPARIEWQYGGAFNSLIRLDAEVMPH